MSRPDLLEQWHPENPLRPADVSSATEKIVWLCSAGPDHQWTTTIAHRLAGQRCPFCFGGRISVTNSLATCYPDVAAQLDVERTGKTAAEFRSASSQRAWWRCENGHSWQATVGNRTRLGHGCRQCSGRVAVPGKTSLAALRPDLLEQWDYEQNIVDPDTVIPNYRTAVWWRCPVADDHRWDAPPSARVRDGQGCPICAGQRVAASTSFATKHPALVAEFVADRSEYAPSSVTAGSKKKAWWTCPAGHPDYQAQFVERSQGQGCPYCAGKRVAPGQSLADLHPQVAAEWHPTKNTKPPTDFTPGASRKAWWQCRVDPGHEWSALIKHRTGSGAGCPKCVRVRRSSAAELRLRELIGSATGVLDNQTLKLGGRRRDIDILLAAAPVAIEYDGNYFHQSDASYARDRKKTALLHAAGYTVIRVREHPLAPLTDHDVTIGTNDGIVEVAQRVLARIQELHPDALAGAAITPAAARAALERADAEVAKMRADYAARKPAA